MISFIYTALAFVVAISVLVVVHEFGHYWVARRMGVKVLRFSVGFRQTALDATFRPGQNRMGDRRHSARWLCEDAG